ncbi:MAG: PAS domain S-box protein [Burkholderiales bacterium]|nr:PAS domain S-box protein [Burkholderiales bacterium]
MTALSARHRLKYRLLAGTGALALAGILFLGAIADHLSRRQLAHDQGLLLEQVAQRLALRLARDLGTRADQIVFLAGLEQLRDRAEPAATRLALLQTARAADPFYAWISLTDATGTITVSTEPALVGRNVASRDWFVHGRHGLHFGDAHDARLLAGLRPKPRWDELPLRLVDISIPVFDPSGAFLGVLGAHVTMDWVYAARQQLLASFRIEEVDLIVLDRAGAVLVGTPDAPALQTNPGALAAVREARGPGSGGKVHAWPDGRDYLTATGADQAYGRFPGFGWTVVTRVPAAVAFGPAAALASQLVLWGLLGGLVVAAALWWMVGRAMRPLEQLSDAARRIASADLHTPIPAPEGSGEVAVFARSLTDLVHALQASQKRFEHLFRDAPVPLCHVGADGTVRALNASFERTFGYGSADLRRIDDWWRLAFPAPGRLEAARATWDRAVAATAPDAELHAGEFHVTCRDGQERIVRMTGLRIDDGLLAALYDVTAQRLAEDRLRLWAESFEKAGLGIAISDARSNRLVAVNAAFARDRGHTREAMIGMGVTDMTPPDLLAGVREQVRALDRTGHAVFESEHLRSDGQRFPCLFDISVLFDSDGKPANRVAFAIDISHFKSAERQLLQVQAKALEDQRAARLATLNQMEDANKARLATEASLAALRESEERLQLFFEHAPAALAMFDREMRYLAVSRRWREARRIGDRDVRGLHHYTLFPGIGDDWKDVHRRALAGEVITAEADRFVYPDGRVEWFRWEVRPWRAADGTIGGIVIFSEDITSVIAAREEIRQLNANLERRVEQRTAELTAANRELDSFAYAVSHDLRAPLRAISGFSGALAEDYEAQLPEDAQKLLAHIQAASRRMGELIDGLLSLSQSGSGELLRDPVDLSASATRALAALARAEPGRTVAWSVEPGLAATGDPRMIDSVLENLLSNAWKYTARTAHPEIRVHAEERAGQRWFCVTDNGAGFRADHAGRLFKPFSRLHPSDQFPGIGIGLATVERIIRRHGGTIEARGEPGRGATFSFTLPAPAAAVGAAAARALTAA